jgi:predicted RNA-binding Zn-ribbon protein involved in translation (DUF1610 family)
MMIKMQMAQFVCSNHPEGAKVSYVSNDQVNAKMAPIKCPDCGRLMIFNGFKEMN